MEASASRPFRIGVLGAAWIAPPAVIQPATKLQGIQIHAIAARDAKRAQAFAKKHKIPVVHNTYDELLADSDLDAVYVPLPNSLHKEWTIRALKAGKHVLCEKPMGCNEEEVKEMFASAKEHDRLLVEAFHWRFHPLAKRMSEIIASGELGRIKRVQASMCIPILSGTDIRYNWTLGGGSTMDTGCYAINCVRVLAGDTLHLSGGVSVRETGEREHEREEERPHVVDNKLRMEVVSAEASVCYPQIDKHMKATLRFTAEEASEDGEGESEGGADDAQGIAATVSCSLYTLIPQIGAIAVGEKGELRVTNYVAPFLYHRLVTKLYNTNTAGGGEPASGGGWKWWMVPKEPKCILREETVCPLLDTAHSTYYYQLQAFVEAVKAGLTANSPPEETLRVLPFHPEHDALRNAAAIDMVYMAAGLKKRGDTGEEAV